MNDKERILSGLSSLAEWLERNGFGDDCEGLRDTTALIERLAAENAALRAEVERLTPREMTLGQALKVLPDDLHSCYLRGHLTEQMVRYIAQGLERDAKGGD